MPSETKGTPQPISLGDDKDKPKDFRQQCKYGKECYQKNPMHHQKFRHPKDEDSMQDTEGDISEPESKRAKLDKEKVREPEPEAKLDEEELTKEKDTQDDTIGGENQSAPLQVAKDENDVKVEDENSVTIPDFKDWPKDPLASIEQKFLTKMPEDFIGFWDFCRGINREDPCQALLKTCGLLLVGPFDILAGKEMSSTKLNDYLCHYRYYRDPPEFQTVLASADENSNFHIGYFRDDPKELPAFVATLGGKKGTPEYDSCKLTMTGENLFAAIFLHIGQLINRVDPFKMTALQKLKESIHVHASMKNQDQSFSLEAKTTSMKCRDKKKVAMTFHGAGLVVPYDKDTQLGYRQIPESNASLKKILDRIVESHKGDCEEAKNKAFDALQELVTNVQFANDEGDPGMGLELGIDVLMHGGEFLNSTAKHLLAVSYDLLNRGAFAKIATAHLHRRKETEPFFKAH